jgi:hypothetical protein
MSPTAAWLLTTALWLSATPDGAVVSPESVKARAQSALQAARAALTRTKSEPRKRTKDQERGASRLAEAEVLCQAEKYDACANAADEAWTLATAHTQNPTRFAVEVQDSGTTNVRARTGKPIAVTAHGVSRPIYPGQIVKVTEGKPPAPPLNVPNAPSLKTPDSAAQLRLKPNGKGLGPVTLAWEAVRGAASYEVTVRGTEATPLLLASQTPTVNLPPMPAGSYRWSVQALAAEVKSDPSEERTFELVEDPLKLEVKGGSWK